MFCDYYGILFLWIFLVKSTYSCSNITLNNITYGHVQSLNFFLGKSQPKNHSCSWKIENERQLSDSYFIVSLRSIELEYNDALWSNELILKSDNKIITINNLNDQIFFFLSSTSILEIDFRAKPPQWQSTSLNIQRFLLEFIHVNNYYYYNNNEYFHCQKSGLIIPKQWQCNCVYECQDNDYSDEEGCPLCRIIRASNSLLCHSHETWCLPTTNQADPKGFCIPHAKNAQCSYSTNCETILSTYQDHGEISLDNSMIADRESLCLVIITKENHKIKLNVNSYDLINQRPEYELSIYDGSPEQKQLISFTNKPYIQTYQHHIATIVIRKRSSEAQSTYNNQYSANHLLLNVTWLTSLCPDEQFVCSTRYELKCYTHAQRCDGNWDCVGGDDELGCLPASCPTTFACYNQLRLPSDRPNCYTWYERCNGRPFCNNRIDEQNCTNWWCNANNGTFLCKNRNCIYESWVCDGTDDCGDKSDETNCPRRIPRRVITAIIIGITICSTLFLIALGCTCKLFHLRTAEQRAAILLNPDQFLEQRRLNRPETAIDHTTDDTQRLAPPSYNQTMGFTNDNEERQAVLAEHLRLAGLANLIPVPSRHRSRRHRRHRRSHHQDSNEHLVSRQSNRFRSLFTRNHLSINNNQLISNELDISERDISLIQPIILTTRTSIESRELPPAYSERQLLTLNHHNDDQTSTLVRIHKQQQQIPLNTIEEQPSTSSTQTIDDDDDDEQISCDDDHNDDDKMLMP